MMNQHLQENIISQNYLQYYISEMEKPVKEFVGSIKSWRVIKQQKFILNKKIVLWEFF